jgi:esterase/lipase
MTKTTLNKIVDKISVISEAIMMASQQHNDKLADALINIKRDYQIKADELIALQQAEHSITEDNEYPEVNDEIWPADEILKREA